MSLGVDAEHDLGRDVPDGAIVLSGAAMREMTMWGDEMCSAGISGFAFVVGRLVLTIRSALATG